MGDMEALFRAALETGTVMEINATTERLGLNDTHVLGAKELGVPLVISTDSHSQGHLEKLRYGVAMARRGWCEARHILNTMPLGDFMSFIKTPKPERMRVFVGRGGQDVSWATQDDTNAHSGYHLTLYPSLPAGREGNKK